MYYKRYVALGASNESDENGRARCAFLAFRTFRTYSTNVIKGNHEWYIWQNGGPSSLLEERGVSRKDVRIVVCVSYILPREDYDTCSSRSPLNARQNTHIFFCIYYTITALPRVGVARPNGSYVARTPKCVGRAIPSRFGRSSGIVALTERLLHGYESAEGRQTLFPLALYAVAKVYYWSCFNVRTRKIQSPRRLSIGIVDLASG